MSSNDEPSTSTSTSSGEQNSKKRKVEGNENEIEKRNIIFLLTIFFVHLLRELSFTKNIDDVNYT